MTWAHYLVIHIHTSKSIMVILSVRLLYIQQIIKDTVSYGHHQILRSVILLIFWLWNFSVIMHFTHMLPSLNSKLGTITNYLWYLFCSILEWTTLWKICTQISPRHLEMIVTAVSIFSFTPVIMNKINNTFFFSYILSMLIAIYNL